MTPGGVGRKIAVGVRRARCGARSASSKSPTRRQRQKSLIERAYLWGAAWGLSGWGMDEAGPSSATPLAGTRWQRPGQPTTYPHEYLRPGTATMLTLFHPATGQVRIKGLTRPTNPILPGWLTQELSAIRAALPESLPGRDPQANPTRGESRPPGPGVPVPLPTNLPPRRMLLILDPLAGHKTPAWVAWLVSQGLLPLSTPWGGSGLNMPESVQRIIHGRALNGPSPPGPQHLILWLEAPPRGWNAPPTPCVGAGKRYLRRQRA